MNIDIGWLISELKAQEEKAKENEQECERRERHIWNHEYRGMRKAFSSLIQKMVALENEQPEAITEDSHLRKHDVGRSAASNDITTLKNDLSEYSSETQAVGQNEQTKEHFFCRLADGYDGPRCYFECEKCKKMRLDASAPDK